MSKKVKTIWNICTGALIAIVLVLAFLIAGMRLLGYNVLYVKSGSMDGLSSATTSYGEFRNIDQIPVGSLIYVKEVANPASLKPGDVATFTLEQVNNYEDSLVAGDTMKNGDQVLVTHMIVSSEVKENLYNFTTWGTANYNAECPCGYKYVATNIDKTGAGETDKDRTDFHNQPASYKCPECGAAKSEFAIIPSIDAERSERNLVGKVEFSIPFLGYIAAFIYSPPGTYIAIAAGLLLVLLVFVPEILGSKDKKAAKKSNEEKSAEAPKAEAETAEVKAEAEAEKAPEASEEKAE